MGNQRLPVRRVACTVGLGPFPPWPYAVAERWNPPHILVAWGDDDRWKHWAWVPAGGVRRVNESEWYIFEYRRCPANLRGIRGGARLLGFLPA